MHDFYKEYVTSGHAGDASSDAGNRPYLDWLIARVRLAKESRIVDAACGSGRLVAALRGAGYTHVTGVDISREQVDAGTAKGVSGLICADTVGFLEQAEPASLDAIFALDFLEHLDLDTSLRFLNAARRSLSNDGCLVLHVPNAASPFSLAVRYGDVTHTRAFTDRSLQQLLFPAGLRLEWIEEGRPIVHGFLSLGRRVVWSIGRGLLALFILAETGARPAALSQNITALARPRKDRT